MFLRAPRSDALRDAEATEIMRRLMPDLYFINTPVSRMKRHIALLGRLPEEKLIFDFHRHDGPGLTELTICAYDDAEPGLLSKVCGTLSAMRVNIYTGYVFTVRENAQGPGGATPDPLGRWIVLDTLLISEPYFKRERALTNSTIRHLRDALTAVMQGKVTVAQLLAKARRRPNPLINIYEISVTKSDSNGASITLRTEDAFGLLYRVTSALASIDLHIRVAQVNTTGGATEDIFFVMDRDGQPVSDRDLENIAPRLRIMLQNGQVPEGLTGN